MKLLIVLAAIAAAVADVSELSFPSNEYLPPFEGQVQQLNVAVQTEAEAEPAHTFGPDGYSYKNPVEELRRRRYRIRRRRDVSEIPFPSNEYLPPVEQTPTTEYIAPFQAEAEPAHTFGPDGYSYKNPVEELRRKRYRIRRRRDVSELGFPSQEYLPPIGQDFGTAPIDAFADPAPAHELGPDGYKYKTVKRFRIRRRRDVSELPSQEYLPPIGQDFSTAPIDAFVDPAPAHELGPDGYKYKTVKRFRIRRRRDVSELGFPSQEYLPPIGQDFSTAPIDAFADAAPAHELGPDGYKYKTVKRFRIRRRRDVSELPSQEYLPPIGQDFSTVPIDAFVDPAPAHELGPDGYKYKTVKRFRIRRRRDVSELGFPSQEYLPPIGQDFSTAPIDAFADPAPAHELGPDGYKYKTVKRFRFRHRRY